MFPERIKELRTGKHMTQSELAKFANVTQQTVGAWERGKASPGVEIITKLANFFNVSTDYLLGETNEKYKQDDSKVDIADDRVLMTYQGKPLSKEDREMMLRIMRGKE